MQSSANTYQAADNQENLQGLPANSWGAFALRGDSLLITSGDEAPRVTKIPPTVLYPVGEHQPPVETRILSKDFGKRGLKGSGLTLLSQFQSTVIPDAYAVIRGSFQQEEEESGPTVYTYRVKGGDNEHETFIFGEPALRISDLLPTNDDTFTRLSDLRTRHMLYASIVADLQEMGLSPCDSNGTPHTHHVLIPLGVPVRDLQPSHIEKTREAAKSLRGTFQVEQRNTRTGEDVTWYVDVVGIQPEPQPKGTLYTATRNLDASPAFSKKLFTIYDIGGGDIYEYEADAQGGLISQGKRRGDGTISIARELVALIEEKYGLQISEIEAQEALYTHHIWRGGEEQDISPLMTQLKPRFANLLSRININDRVLTTFVIFTGGGAALLADEIRAKMMAKSDALQEGVDFLIMPAQIAATANVIGLFAAGYYKVQSLISKYGEAYVDLLANRAQVQARLHNLRPGASRWPEDQATYNDLNGQLQQLQAKLQTHVGQHYPEIVQQLIRERKASQR